MNLQSSLCLTLILSGSLVGCSTIHHPTVSGLTDTSSLYLYWGSTGDGTAERFLSARIHPDEAISVGGDDFMDLTGHIELHGASIKADLTGSTGQQAQFYRGSMTLEKPCFAQGGAASGGAGPASWFVVSTNGDCRAVLEHVNSAMGLTNAPFNHPARVALPVLPPLDPATGLPMPAQPVKQP